MVLKISKGTSINLGCNTRQPNKIVTSWCPQVPDDRVIIY